jgi:hypothetical protein
MSGGVTLLPHGPPCPPLPSWDCITILPSGRLRCLSSGRRANRTGAHVAGRRLTQHHCRSWENTSSLRFRPAPQLAGRFLPGPIGVFPVGPLDWLSGQSQLLRSPRRIRVLRAVSSLSYDFVGAFPLRYAASNGPGKCPVSQAQGYAARSTVVCTPANTGTPARPSITRQVPAGP